MPKGAFSGATPDMAHPYGYSFLLTLVLCIFVGFVFTIIVGDHFNERETAVFTVGFLTGGFVFAWFLGAFDTRYGLTEASGYFVGLAGLGYALLRRESEND